MSNSSLVNYVKISPNQSGERTQKITRITPHCVVGQCTVEGLGEWFARPRLKASSNYGIGYNGKVGMYVPEDCRSWCSSSRDNDQRAVTIECASDTKEPYTMTPVVYKTLVELCTEICKRHGKTQLLWIADKERALGYKLAEGEMLLTVHRWFAAKSCPGEWLYSRLGQLADEVTKRLTTAGQADEVIYRVQIGAYKSAANAKKMCDKARAAGFDAFITEARKVIDI